ncbi:hypothetical protein EOPP23_14590 [Endozoicomonas sp. OPT23]|uniref:hypothetical protein n=1 Tax=Endozoicomonas sp. OPT23 TaxID=2072845 RepID=UPI00129B6231|nr:hypothetical protein [Endozoicomonas sp. OPT23]MRI34219.1 hypothetical protein [Endozoicomonas sp. OPT23]
MTSTQYMMGWAVYLAGATGCLLALILITRNFGARVRRSLWLVTAALLYTPWFLAQGSTLFTPALLTSLFDFLSDGQEAATRAGLPVLITSSAALFLGIILPVRKQIAKAEKKAEPEVKKKPRPKSAGGSRKEPSV